jgi:hypothetical protein
LHRSYLLCKNNLTVQSTCCYILLDKSCRSG